MNKIAKIPAKELITLTNEIAKRSVATCESWNKLEIAVGDIYLRL